MRDKEMVRLTRKGLAPHQNTFFRGVEVLMKSRGSEASIYRAANAKNALVEWGGEEVKCCFLQGFSMLNVSRLSTAGSDRRCTPPLLPVSSVCLGGALVQPLKT